MTSTVTFIHTGDLHIGAPIRGLSSINSFWASRLGQAIMESYQRVIREAIARQVDFVVLAGDCFDTSRASYGDFMRFFKGLEQLDKAGIASYLVMGNHDPFTSWADDIDLLPPSAHLMGVGAPTFELFTRDDQPLVMLGGRSYYNQTWPEDHDIAEGITRTAAQQELARHLPGVSLEDVPFMVGIIHTGLQWDKKKAPTTEADLMARGVDYWACGHLHWQLVLPTRENPRIVFPGCIQGRTVQETGARGCFQVTLTAEDASGETAGQVPHVRTELEFIPTASVVFQDIEVDTTAARTLADVSSSIQTALFHENGHAHCEDMVVRIALTGETDLHSFLVQPQVLEQMRKRVNDIYPNFFCDALIDRTRPTANASAQQREGLMPALVMQMANDQRSREDEMANYLQSELVKRGIAIPDSLMRDLGESEDAAELLLLQMLEEGGRS